MAYAQPKEVAKQLCCAICLEQFKEPKVLPCLHTYCKGCLVKLLKYPDHIVTCPECRQDVKITEGDVEKLQSNFWVNNFMTLLSMQDSNMASSQNTLLCDHCDSGDPAVSRCTNCCVFMCEFCVTAHKRITATRSHEIFSLQEVRKVGSKALVKPAFCEKHSGELLKLFCQTCQKTICRDCTIVDHREHKYDFVADIAEKEKSSVRAILEKCITKERAVAEALKAVQNMKSCVLTKISEVNQQVDNFIDRQAKILENHRAKLKFEAITQGRVTVKQLDNQADGLSSLLAQLRSGIDFTNQTIADGDDIKLLSLKTQLVQRLSQLNSSQDQLTPCQIDTIKLKVKRSIDDEGELAEVRYQQCDPQRCTISMNGSEGVLYQTRNNENVHFILIIKDETGDRVTGGGHRVSVHVQFEPTSGYEDETSGLVGDYCSASHNVSPSPMPPQAFSPVGLYPSPRSVAHYQRGYSLVDSQKAPPIRRNASPHSLGLDRWGYSSVETSAQPRRGIMQPQFSARHKGSPSLMDRKVPVLDRGKAIPSLVAYGQYGQVESYSSFGHQPAPVINRCKASPRSVARDQVGYLPVKTFSQSPQANQQAQFSARQNASLSWAEQRVQVTYGAIPSPSQADQQALTVQDNGDGSYTFDYFPKLPGACSLSVMVEGQPINGSPFNWQVYTEEDYLEW
ncbi:tripartite motif-containing protein 45-like [Stylophora pistillata]|nr:tripartite motif-containing protein 45-like [Stylophora pistillata]